jgi:hypothetical protein
LDAGAEDCGPALGCDWTEAARPGGAVAAGGVARGSAFAAATTESGFSGRDAVKGTAGDGAGGFWGAGDAFGGVFSVVRVSVVRVIVALFPEALAGVIGGGIAARCG